MIDFNKVVPRLPVNVFDAVKMRAPSTPSNRGSAARSSSSASCLKQHEITDRPNPKRPGAINEIILHDWYRKLKRAACDKERVILSAPPDLVSGFFQAHLTPVQVPAVSQKTG